MTDPYANIRRALTSFDACGSHYWRDELVRECDPDTIRELLAERDALAQESEALRRCAIKYLGWLNIITKPLDVALREDMADPDMCGDAAIAAASGGTDG